MGNTSGHHKFIRVIGMAAFVLATAFRATAHDIPSDVTVQAFVKPEGQQLRLVVRMPLVTLNPNGAPIANVDIPQRGPGYLDLAHVDSLLRAAAIGAADVLKLYEENTPLSNPTLIAARVSLVSDTSFASYEEAVAHISGPPLPVSTDVYWNQGFFDAMLDFPVRSARSGFAMNAQVGSLGSRVLTVLRFLPPGGGVRSYQFFGDTGTVWLDPRWYQVARTFLSVGFLDILRRTDHLLFLFCLLIPIRRFRALVPPVLSFTVAHSITLIASAYHPAPAGAWFSTLTDTLIALSIVYMAVENIVRAKPAPRLFMTLGFGLLCGFALSSALREMLQFGESHPLVALLSFNVGVELGQTVVLMLLIPTIALLFRYLVRERIGTIILSAFVADTSWHWVGDRAQRMALVDWPLVEILLVLRWVLLFIMALIVFWLILESVRRRERRAAPAVSLESE